LEDFFRWKLREFFSEAFKFFCNFLSGEIFIFFGIFPSDIFVFNHSVKIKCIKARKGISYIGKVNASLKRYFFKSSRWRVNPLSGVIVFCLQTSIILPKQYFDLFTLAETGISTFFQKSITNEKLTKK